MKRNGTVARRGRRPRLVTTGEIHRIAEIAAYERASLKVKKFLVPIDFSAESIKALRYAVPLAQKFDGVIYLISVVETDSFLDDLKNVPKFNSEETRLEEAKARLVALAQKEIGKLIPVFPRVQTGKPYKEIVMAAKKLEVDLIIISTHGYTALKHALLGSTAELVVRHATCPVLVVRERERQ